MGNVASSSLVYTNGNCIGCNKCVNACPAMGACMSVDEGNSEVRRIEVNGDILIMSRSTIISVVFHSHVPL